LHGIIVPPSPPVPKHHKGFCSAPGNEMPL
jgi:hypothetical protein